MHSTSLRITNTFNKHSRLLGIKRTLRAGAGRGGAGQRSKPRASTATHSSQVLLLMHLVFPNSAENCLRCKQ